jgi:predicted membrane protein
MDNSLSPDGKTLRGFGITTGVIVITLFGLLIPWLRHSTWPRWPWVLATCLILTGLIIPRALGPVFKVWMKFGHVMNRVNSTIILTAVFYLVFTPVALFMKLIGRDVLHRKFDEKAESYRIKSDKMKAENFKRPF